MAICGWRQQICGGLPRRLLPMSWQTATMWISITFDQFYLDWFSSPKKATTGIWPGTCGFNRETCWVPGFPLLGQAAKWPKGSEKMQRRASGGFVRNLASEIDMYGRQRPPVSPRSQLQALHATCRLMVPTVKHSKARASTRVGAGEDQTFSLVVPKMGRKKI